MYSHTYNLTPLNVPVVNRIQQYRPESRIQSKSQTQYRLFETKVSIQQAFKERKVSLKSDR